MAKVERGNEGWYWIPHNELIWIPAKLKFTDDQLGTETWETSEGGEVTVKKGTIKNDDLNPVSKVSLNHTLDNLVLLDDFGEGAVLHQLRERFKTDTIYTNISTILVSLNPFKMLPIYASSIIDKYRENFNECAPHVYGIAADAYKRLLDYSENQAVIISGESGAGKTEATKTVLQYLSDVAGSTSNVEQQILETNPVLEAFGNAKTQRNNNSSRFGKWMEVFFATGGRIVAAQIVNYLLEKSRITNQGEGERNYHVFYQMHKGLDDTQKHDLCVKPLESYRYLNQSGCYTVDRMDDQQEWKAMQKAFAQLEVPPDEVAGQWIVVSSVLNIGNLEFKGADKGEGCDMKDMSEVEKLAKVLKLNPTTMQTALTFRSVTIRGSVSMIPLKIHEAEEGRDSLAKALYSRNFDWLVSRLNKTLKRETPPDARTVGILDIFGFEIFEKNVFEQFCINYANEKLQQHFNEHIFKLEMAEYKKEEISIESIVFVDNVECLKLIEQKGSGILGMLDEEVNMPKGSDEQFIQKMHQRYAKEQKHPFYEQLKKRPETFIIKHYAGAVTYVSTGFLEKNRDKIQDSLMELMVQSEIPLIKTIFSETIKTVSSSAAAADEKKDDGGGRGGRGRGRGRRGGGDAKAGGAGGGAKKTSTTLGASFKNQLASLMATLHAANPHFIRCIKTNHQKKPNIFDSDMILRQMKYAGLFEAIRIRRAGYPFRLSHEAFAKRYRLLLDAKSLVEVKQMANDHKRISAKVLAYVGPKLDPKDWVMGKFSVLMRNSQRVVLTKLRDEELTKIVLKIQGYARGNQERAKYRKMIEFIDRAKKAVEGRDLATLKKMLEELKETGWELYYAQTIEITVAFLEEEIRIMGIFNDAIKEFEANKNNSGTLSMVDAGLEQVKNINEMYAGEKHTVDFNSKLQKVQEIAEILRKKDKARKLLKQAMQEEDLKKLELSINAAVDADLPDEEWIPAHNMAQAQLYEQKIVEDTKALTAKVDAKPEEDDVAALEVLVALLGTVGLDGERKTILNAGHNAIRKACFENLKSMMMAAKEEGKRMMPDHTFVEKTIPLPPKEQQIQSEIIPKLVFMKFDDIAMQGRGFIAEQMKLRSEALKKAHYNNMEATIKDASEGAKDASLVDLTIDKPLAEQDLPVHEKKLKEVIIPALEKLEFSDFVKPAQTCLQDCLQTRSVTFKDAHRDNIEKLMKQAQEESKAKVFPPEDETPAKDQPLPALEEEIKSTWLPRLGKVGFQDLADTIPPWLEKQQQARVDSQEEAQLKALSEIIAKAEVEGKDAKYAPNATMSEVPKELPPNEQSIQDTVLPRLKKLGFAKLVANATEFLKSQMDRRITVLKKAHLDNLNQSMAAAEAEAGKYMPTEDKPDVPAELPPLEKKLKEETIPIMEKAGFKEMVDTANAFLKDAASTRANKSEMIKLQKANLDAAAKKKAAEELAKKEEEMRKAKEERKRKEEADQAAMKAAEEEAKKQADARKAAEEKEKADLEAKKRNAADAEAEAERKAKEAREAEKKAQEEEERKRKEEAEEAQKAAKAALEAKSQVKMDKAGNMTVVQAQPKPLSADGSPPPPDEDMFDCPPPPPPEEMEMPPPPPEEDDGSEEREQELLKAIKRRSLNAITNMLLLAETHGDHTRTVRIARNLKEVLLEEQKILTSIAKCLEEYNVVPLKSLLREAASLGLDHPTISEARHVCYGMSKAELLTARVTLALSKRDQEMLKELLEEAKEEGIENDETEHARDYLAMTSNQGDWNSRMRQARATVTTLSASASASYKQFIDTKGIYPLRKFINLRSDNNYAKDVWFNKGDVKKKRLVWQKDDMPRSLVRLNTAHCGNQQKSRIVKRIAKQIFKNIRGYMGDQYHAYPVTLAYEVVNTGVNEELLRDEIFCQLIKQTTKNPSQDSALLGWKLFYLSISTFWPSDELRPCVISHLAAHAHPRITQKEFGFNSIADLAYHCFKAIDVKTPPILEPPSMSDIEKITNGTLGSVMSYFAGGDDEIAEEPPVPDGDEPPLPDGDEPPMPPDDP